MEHDIDLIDHMIHIVETDEQSLYSPSQAESSRFRVLTVGRVRSVAFYLPHCSTNSILCLVQGWQVVLD
jgi:hypothetical protein